MSDSYALWLSNLNTNMPLYVSYFAPWIGIGSASCALAALYIRRRDEDDILKFLLKWQYTIILIFSLNMAFWDTQFTRLMSYNSFINVTDGFCRIQYVVVRVIYCSAPWMQVVG